MLAAARKPSRGSFAVSPMIPSVVAAEVTGALGDFLATGFGPSNPALAHVIDDFLAQPENPYLSIALPFQPATEGGEPFPQVPLAFTPYRHQRTAFSRLAAGVGRPTVVATGTGSGKTECFLFPILDYCRERIARGSSRRGPPAAESGRPSPRSSHGTMASRWRTSPRGWRRGGAIRRSTPRRSTTSASSASSSPPTGCGGATS